MQTAYDPDRVRHLGTRVEACIDELARCRSDDPAAADAMRVIRLTRRNLEEQWLPLVREIEQSTAMTVWTSTRLGWLRADRPALWLHLRHDAVATPSRPADVRRLIELLRDRPWFDDLASVIQAARVAEEMRAMLSDPQACLDVLGDPWALLMLAQWGDLPDDVVQELVATGLYDAVAERPDRLSDGYAVLAELTELANGTLDDGFQPGMARGVAVSMTGYITTLAPAISQEGRYPVYVVDEPAGVDVRLGTYDDVADLFGALLRDDEAQAAVGLALGGYAARVVDDLDTTFPATPGLEHVAGVTDLVADAARAEQAELVAAAAEAASRWRSIGEAVGFGVGAALTAAGAGPTAKVVADRAVAIATDALARVDPDRLPGRQIPATVYDAVTVATVAMVVERPELRSPLGLRSIDDAHWDEVDRRLERLDDTMTTEHRRHRLAQLERWIEGNAAPLAALLATVRTAPGMHELTESRADADPDDD